MWQLNNLVIKEQPVTLEKGNYPAGQYPKSIFQKWSEEDLNSHGIYLLTIIKPVLNKDQKYGDPVPDFVNHTYTYPVIEKTQEEIEAQIDHDIEVVKQYAHQDILNDHADWKQRNMTANAIKVLVDLLVSENVLTQEQVDATELNGLKQILININARRTLSDQQEQDLINGVKTIEDIHNELYPV